MEYSSIGTSISVFIVVILSVIVLYLVYRALYGDSQQFLPPVLSNMYQQYVADPIGGTTMYVVDEGDDYLDDVDDYIRGDDKPVSEKEELPIKQVQDTIAAPSPAPAPEPVTTPEPEPEPEPQDLTSCPTKLVEENGKIALYFESMPKEEGKNPIYFDSLDDYVYYAQVQRKQTGLKCPILYLDKDNTSPREEKPTQESQVSVGLGKLDLSNIDTISNYFKQQQQPQRQINQPVAYLPYKPCRPYNYPLPPAANMALQKVPIMPRKIPDHPPMVPYVDANRQLNPSGTYGFDPSSQYTGKYTILDQIHDSTETQYPSGLSANAMDPNWGGAVFTNEKLNEGQYVGDEVTQEATQQSTISQGVSATPGHGPMTADAMAQNWGGTQYSRQQVAEGQYQGDDVFMRPA